MLGLVREVSKSIAVDGARRLVRASCVLLICVFAAGCANPFGSNEEEDLAFTDKPADQLYNEGLAYLNAGDHKSALLTFEDIDTYYPYSEYARKALVLQAFTHFSRGRYSEAAVAGRRFVTLYPGDEDAAYAQYIVGQSYFRQIASVERDQAATRQAYQALNDLVRKYPDSEYVADAREKMRIAQDQLAGKEMEVGRYYLQRKQYSGAINRFRTVVEEYQTTRHVEEALARLTESYYALGVVSEAKTAAAVLGTNYPDSEWYRDSYNLLQTGGHDPAVSTGSWIERAFGRVNPL